MKRPVKIGKLVNSVIKSIEETDKKTSEIKKSLDVSDETMKKPFNI